MPNSVYRKLLNLDLFRNSLALYLYSKFRKALKLQKKTTEIWRWLGQFVRKKLFTQTIVEKINGKSKEVKQNWTRPGLWDLVLRNFWLLWLKFYLWKGDWALSSVSTQLWDFPNLSSFPKILSLKSLNNSWGNSYIKYNMLVFTCGESNLQ